ncbi:hypothetical protein [Streptomyces sp. R41]|uniref:Terpene synthase n=1 Tax=Streptomyces sp. R41 TaxID=3238632 RepID=A0AB39R9G7_9ACTN
MCALRPIAGGAPVYLDLLERGWHFGIPESIQSTAPVNRLREHLGDIVAQVNDAFSAKKEKESGGFHDHVIIRERSGPSLEEVLARSREQLHAAVRRFQDHAELLQATDEYRLLSDTGQPGVEYFITGMGNWQRSNYDWHKESGRYE